MNTIHTKGYGGLTPTQLVEDLKAAGIEAVVDVRRTKSRAFRAYYNSGDRQIGITLSMFNYHHASIFGNEFQTEDNDGLEEYSAMLSNPDDNMKMDILVEAVFAKKLATCFLCAEKHAYVDSKVNCHRVYVAEAVAAKLTEMTGAEWKIVHL